MKKIFLVLSLSLFLSEAFAMQAGKISWYGPGFNGRKTASGEIFNQYALTAAHKSLPFGTKVKITNPTNNKSVIIRVNDRGPFVKGREFDLSKGAAQAIGVKGIGKIYFEILS